MKVQKFVSMLMIAVLAIFMAAMVTGCSNVKKTKIIDGVNQAIDVAGMVCSTAPLFSDKLSKPAEKCSFILQKAIELKDGGKRTVGVFIDVSDCAKQYKSDKNINGLVQCVDEIDGAKLIIEEIEKSVDILKEKS